MSSQKEKSLGEIIKEDMKARKLNASAIAREMNVSRQVINQIDTRKTFDLEFLQKLKEASGLDYTHYAFDSVMKNLLHEEPGSYNTGKSNYVTLTLAVSCKRDRVGEFDSFLTDLENVAEKYGYLLA